MEKLENIVFDEQDQELFLIDDLQLKAEAIRNSILPKLDIVINYAVNQIDKVYTTNVFDDCMIAKAPHYRLSQRVYGVRKDYQEARAGIRGQRKFGKWNGIRKANGEEAQLPSLPLDLILNKEGLVIFLGNKGKFLSKNSYRKIFKFLGEYDSSISLIQKSAGVFDTRVHFGEDWSISNKKWLDLKFKKEDFDTSFFSFPVSYPLKYDKLKSVIDRVTLLYPIFHAYIRIAKGLKVDFDSMVRKASKWKSMNIVEEAKQVYAPILDLGSIKMRAETKIKIMPGIRWQVFQRDNWRCVACGHRAGDKVILHVDHIKPRSKGGKDEISNYQTLCDVCNIGKSNKDETDLRV